MTDNMLFLASYVALWLLVVFQTLVLLEVVRRSGPSQQPELDPAVAGERLESGVVAPSFEAPTLIGGMLRSGELLGQPTLLAFITPTCPACRDAGPEVEKMRSSIRAQLVVFCRAETTDCREFTRKHYRDAVVVVDRDGEIGRTFKVSGVPTAIALDAEWRVLKYGHPRKGSDMEFVVTPVLTTAGSESRD